MLTGVMAPLHHAISWTDFISVRASGFFLAYITFGTVLGLTLDTILPRMRRLLSRTGWEEERAPPRLAEFLLCIFARAKDIDALMGDFEELFARDCAAGMPRCRAVARYWARVIRSVGPQMWQAVRRIGLFGLIVEALRR